MLACDLHVAYALLQDGASRRSRPSRQGAAVGLVPSRSRDHDTLEGVGTRLVSTDPPVLVIPGMEVTTADGKRRFALGVSERSRVAGVCWRRSSWSTPREGFG